MRIKISTSEDNSSFILSPVDFNLQEIRGLKIYIKNLNDGYIENERIIIPIENIDVLDLYHNIVRLFENRFNCKVEKENDAGSLLNDAIGEEERFTLFSKKALAIRNNDIDKNELTDFLHYIEQDRFLRLLKPFQLLSAYHLAFSQNACNFSVPGSGKTSTVLAAFACF